MPLAAAADTNRIEAPVTFKAYLMCAFASFVRQPPLPALISSLQLQLTSQLLCAGRNLLWGRHWLDLWHHGHALLHPSLRKFALPSSRRHCYSR